MQVSPTTWKSSRSNHLLVALREQSVSLLHQESPVTKPPLGGDVTGLFLVGRCRVDRPSGGGEMAEARRQESGRSVRS